MPTFEVLTRTQRIVVLPNTSVSIVKHGTPGPAGPPGPIGPTGPQGLDGDTVATNLYVRIDGIPITVQTPINFTTAPTVNGEPMEALTMLTEDAAHISGEQGLLGLAVRRDADTALVDADGDYSALLVDALGRLKVKTVKDSQVVGGAVTIATGTAITSTGGDVNNGIVDLTKKTLVGIQIPSVWTAAALTFSASMDGGITFNDLYDDNMVERTIAVVASRAVTVDPTKYMGITHLKFRSGTGVAPINQDGARTIIYSTIAL